VAAAAATAEAAITTTMTVTPHVKAAAGVVGTADGSVIPRATRSPASGVGVIPNSVR
jgi:hypothetical protein